MDMPQEQHGWPSEGLKRLEDQWFRWRMYFDFGWPPPVRLSRRVLEHAMHQMTPAEIADEEAK